MEKWTCPRTTTLRCPLPGKDAGESVTGFCSTAMLCSLQESGFPRRDGQSTRPDQPGLSLREQPAPGWRRRGSGLSASPLCAWTRPHLFQQGWIPWLNGFVPSPTSPSLSHACMLDRRSPPGCWGLEDPDRQGHETPRQQLWPFRLSFAARRASEEQDSTACKSLSFLEATGDCMVSGVGSCRRQLGTVPSDRPV